MSVKLKLDENDFLSLIVIGIVNGLVLQNKLSIFNGRQYNKRLV